MTTKDKGIKGNTYHKMRKDDETSDFESESEEDNRHQRARKDEGNKRESEQASSS